MNPLRMRWLGIACFEIVLPNGKTLVINPFVDDAVSSPITSDQFEGCDYLFLTHGHYDHILDTGKLAPGSILGRGVGSDRGRIPPTKVCP
jgi:L-ascorbate metabolism protein UlaG (beta-lactamase superfamily)